jgi:hypothetical protein
LTDNPELSLKVLERKVKNEFSLRSEIANPEGESFKVEPKINLSVLSIEELKMLKKIMPN